MQVVRATRVTEETHIFPTDAKVSNSEHYYFLKKNVQNVSDNGWSKSNSNLILFLILKIYLDWGETQLQYGIMRIFYSFIIIFLNSDIDECQENKITGGHKLCSQGSTCVNHQGDYTCVPPKTRPIAIGIYRGSYFYPNTHTSMHIPFLTFFSKWFLLFVCGFCRDCYWLRNIDINWWIVLPIQVI